MIESIIMFLSHGLPIYRAFQDAGIDMLDIEGIAAYAQASLISKMEA